MRLFKRNCTVTIVRQPSGFVATNPQFFETLGNAIEVTDLRVQFSVTKNLAKEPNKCEVTITNLNSHTRGELERRPIGITMAAGHDGSSRLLFTGDLRHCVSKVDGTDWATSLQVGDGSRAFAHARFNKSYKPPIRVHQVLTDAAASMGLTLPPEAEQSAELKQALATGISKAGPSRDVLTKLLAPYGYNWSVQNGTLRILRDGDVAPGEAILINESTGMIGTPERSDPDKPSGRSELTFQVLLYPEIVPGNRVKLESRFINGIFRVQEVKHEGDTHGDDWTTSVRARPT